MRSSTWRVTAALAAAAALILTGTPLGRPVRSVAGVAHLDPAVARAPAPPAPTYGPLGLPGGRPRCLSAAADRPDQARRPRPGDGAPTGSAKPKPKPGCPPR